MLDHFVVSTEDDEIADIARDAGATVHKRPKKLATDQATTISLLQHIVSEISADSVVLLQPTSPIRVCNLIDRAIQLFIESGADTVATGFDVQFYKWGSIDNIPRQKLKGYFYDNGSVYVNKASHISRGLWSGKKKVPLHVEEIYHHEIDTELQFRVTEFVHKQILDGHIKAST